MVVVGPSNSGATARMSSFASELRFEDLPNTVVHRARRLLVDTLGCALGGVSSEFGAIALGMVRLTGGHPEATVIGIGERSSALAAAGANARLAGALDGDDTFPSAGQTSHHATSAVSAALALCERSGASGRELLTAIVAGYEVAARFGASAPPALAGGAGATATWRVGGGPAGVLAATVASARALRLDAPQMENALGIAGAHIDLPPIKWLSARVAPMAKSMDGGWHATSGVQAAYMSSLGMTGHAAIFDGEFGLWRTLGYPDFDFDRLLDRLGTRWYTLDGSLKRWPCQYWMHQPLTAFARTLEVNTLRPQEIERVILRTNSRSLAPRFCDQEPEGAVTCEFNLPHAAAMLAFEVTAGPRWYSSWALESEAVAEFRRRVFVEPEPQSQDVTPWTEEGVIKRLPASCMVTARSTEFSGTAEAGLGNEWFDDTRLSDDDLRAKFRAMAQPMADASEIWGERVEEIMEAAFAVDRLDDVRGLGRLLAYPSPTM